METYQESGILNCEHLRAAGLRMFVEIIENFEFSAGCRKMSKSWVIFDLNEAVIRLH